MYLGTSSLEYTGRSATVKIHFVFRFREMSARVSYSQRPPGQGLQVIYWSVIFYLDSSSFFPFSWLLQLSTTTFLDTCDEDLTLTLLGT